jgi:hypothetical protein
MTPDEVEKTLDQSASLSVPLRVDRAAVERIESAILGDLRPVHPLAPAWVFALAFTLLFAALAAVSGWALGLHGIRALSPPQRALIFPALIVAAVLGAIACARAMRPAAGTRLGLLTLLLSAIVLPILFLFVFHNYSTQAFVAEGIPCLVAGLCVAIPTGLGIALITRLGFVLDWGATGLAAGALSGLTGLGMLELHCPNPKAIHVLVWHVAVVVVSAVLGFMMGKIADNFRRRTQL